MKELEELKKEPKRLYEMAVEQKDLSLAFNVLKRWKENKDKRYDELDWAYYEAELERLYEMAIKLKDLSLALTLLDSLWMCQP